MVIDEVIRDLHALLLEAAHKRVEDVGVQVDGDTDEDVQHVVDMNLATASHFILVLFFLTKFIVVYGEDGVERHVEDRFTGTCPRAMCQVQCIFVRMGTCARMRVSSSSQDQSNFISISVIIGHKVDLDVTRRG